MKNPPLKNKKEVQVAHHSQDGNTSSQLMVGSVRESSSGPIPSASEMAGYKQVSPHLVEVIIDQFVKESEHGRKTFFFQFWLGTVIVIFVIALLAFFAYLAFKSAPSVLAFTISISIAFLGSVKIVTDFLGRRK